MDAEKITSLLKRQNLTPPELLTVAITGQCNLHCAHCWVEAGPTSTAAQVSTQKLQRLIEDFAALDGAALRLTGGEPLLHPDWLELLAAGDAAGLKLLLQTNGMLFEDNNLRALQALELKDLSIQISLDGATAASHDRVRGAGAYEQTLLGIKRLSAAGFGQTLELFFTEMRHNLHELPELLLQAERLGIGSVSSGCLVACGRAGAAEGIAPPEPEQYLELLQRHADDQQFQRCYAKLGTIAALEWCADESAGQGCAFIKNPYLTAEGTLYPCLLCHADEYSVAEVFSKGWAAALIEGVPLWSKLQKVSRQRISAIESCQECALLKSCAAGCMGRAWGSFGDFMQAEDRCRQRQAVLLWREKF
ncbi:MAG TPA: radical SAM protein [Malonomonas sp.]